MRSLRNIFSLAAVLLLVGCVGGGSGPGEEKPAAGQSGGAPDDLRLDPLELAEDLQNVPARQPNRSAIGQVKADGNEPGIEAGIDTLAVVTPDAIDSLNNQVYRIQLLTTKLFGEAQQARRVAEEIFDRPLYVDYEVPYFKLRVGGFANRDEAEAYQLKAKAVGYENAWVVVVNVDINRLPGLYDSLPVPAEDSLTDGYGPYKNE